jgi:hypothetical protein
VQVQRAPCLLHQFKLGSVKKTLAYIKSYMQMHTNKKRIIDQFNNLFHQMPRISELEHFNGLVFEFSFLRGELYIDILFQLPHVLYGLELSSKVTKVVCQLCKVYVKLRKTEFTIASLELLIDDLEVLEDLLKKSGLKKFCKSSFNIVKNHDFTHYAPSIVFFEAPFLSSTEYGEMTQKLQIKEVYKRGNGKDSEDWIKKNNNLNQAVKVLLKAVKKEPKQKEGNIKLTGKICELNLGDIRQGQPGQFLLDRDPSTSILQECLLKFSQSLPNYSPLYPMPHNIKITVYQSVFIAEFRVLASDKFHKRPRFDNVRVFNGSDEDWFAKVVVIFTCLYLEEILNLAFVRFYKDDTPKYDALGLPRVIFYGYQVTNHTHTFQIIKK